MMAASSERRTRDPVLRHSVDHRSPEAIRRRPFSTARPSDARIRSRAFVQIAREYQLASVADGPKRFRGALGKGAVELLELVLKNLNFGMGTCDSALSQLEVGFDGKRKMIMRLRDRMVKAGFLEIVRRSMSTGAPKRFGVPQRIQISNLTIPTPHKLPPEWYQRYLDLCARYRAEESERFRRVREGSASSPQQRAERRQARRKQALADRPPAPRRPATATSAATLNPAGAARTLGSVKLSFDRDRADEDAQAAIVAENSDALLAEVDRLCGRHASPS